MLDTFPFLLLFLLPPLTILIYSSLLSQSTPRAFTTRRIILIHTSDASKFFFTAIRHSTTSAIVGRLSTFDVTHLAASTIILWNAAMLGGAPILGSQISRNWPRRTNGTAQSNTDGGLCLTSIACLPLAISSSKIPKLKTSLLGLKSPGAR
ncbi:hypothetical protein V8G54_034891 [Vigna mungo]|uniref:Uncharacterized protein n=1 Tax=Vigna mungo TaxID=3915 RepID=A0AAQ3MDZ5_VIGMU